MSTRPHVWVATGLRRIPWAVCDRCALVRLKNEISERAARKPCEGGEDR